MGDEHGYVGIGIYNGKRTYNFGVLVRTARVFGADFVFSVGHRNPGETSSTNAELTIPVFHFETIELCVASIPAIEAKSAPTRCEVLPLPAEP